MIGPSGIGKSNFWAQDDKAFFIEAEAGLNFERVHKLPARSWEDLRDIYAALKTAEQKGAFPYSIVVLDTIDRVIDFAEDEIVMKGKEKYKSMAESISTIGDIPNGGGWSKTRELVANFMDKLEQLPCAIAYVGHLSVKKIEDGVRKYDKKTISLWAGVGNDMLAWPDHLMHIEAQMMGDRLQRTVWTKPTQSREAKSRGGVIPDGMKWGESMKDNYDAFRKIFK